MDFGATKHMTSYRLAFDTYEVFTSQSVHLGDDSILEAIGIGSIVAEVMVRDKINKIRINECLHVLKWHANLLSASKLVLSGLKVQFNIRASDGHPVAFAPREGNLYHLHVVKVHGIDAANLVQSNEGDGGLQLWHRSLGHLNKKCVRTLRSMVTGIDLTQVSCSSPLVCEACIEGKQHWLSFPTEGAMRATKSLENVHSDVCGPMRTTSMDGAKYFITFIDDFSRKVWLYVLKTKYECFIRFKEFKALVEMQSEHTIKTFYLDNGGEFMSKAFMTFLVDHSIAKELSTPYRPQQNEVIERANRTIIEIAKSMIHAQKLNKSFWTEAVVNAVYTRNRCPTKVLERMTPEETWSGRKPNVAHMRVFRCLAYAMVPDEKRGKLDAKGTKCLFLGYCEDTKVYRLMCL
jgi:transposase InsO family protein